MEIALETKVGTASKIKRAVTMWRENPSDLTLAAYAGFHYTKTRKSDMVLIKGNTLGRRVFHIVKPDASVMKYTALRFNNVVYVVKQNGEVWRGLASDTN